MVQTVETPGGEIPVVFPDAGGEWNPRSKYTELVLRIQNLLSDGEDRTARDIYYALEARGQDYDYRTVKTAVKRGREAGFIHPNQIVDTSRRAATTPFDGYEGPDEFLSTRVEGIWNAYREDFWKEQETYVEVWLEKASLASLFKPICDEWNVRLEATRGDWSHSKIFRATQRLIGKLNDGKRVRILYYGDFNPSGFHAPVAVQASMGYYGLDFRNKKDSDSEGFFDIWPSDRPTQYGDGPADLMFEREALNLEHIKKYDLPENPTPSSTDKDRKLRDRFMSQVTEGRDTNVELNALKEYHRDEFEDMIEDSIRRYVDEESKGEVEARVREARADLREAVEIDRSALD